MKKILLGSLIAACFLGFISTGIVHAQDFTAWATIWFKGGGVSERGLQAPVLPGGGRVTADNERDHNLYIEVVSCDGTAATCSFNVCSFNTATAAWTLATGITVPIIGGSALDFLTLLDVTFTEATGITEQYVVPLRLRAKTTREAPNTIRTASFNTIGGYHVETFGTPATTMSIGAVSFVGTMIPVAKVSTVPPGCTGG